MTERSGLRDPPLLAAIRKGLLAQPRRLPPECLYDELGSALFEAITALPEYGLTRADLRLLGRNAGEVAARLTPPLDVAELGSGSGRKTRILLERLADRGSVRYLPIDISRAALEDCARETGRIEGVEVVPLQARHLEGLRRAAADRRAGASLLVLFLGSNIGNFDRGEAQAFLTSIRSLLQTGDALLLAADLEKPETVLLAGYDDAVGVTAAFNRNVLARLNRELGADFDPRAFEHDARYERAERRVEMYLVSRVRQSARIPALGLELEFAEGEGLWVESSHKFLPGEIARMGEAAGLQAVGEWRDQEWPFAQTLLMVP